MKLHYTSVLNLLLENEIELAKSYLQDVINDCEKANHNVPRSVYNHNSSNIIESIGLDEKETKRDSINLIAEIALSKMSKKSEIVELIESKPWPTTKKMFIYHTIARANEIIDESDIGI